MSTAIVRALPLHTRENESGPRGATNTAEGLTHSSDCAREGLAMKATCIICDRSVKVPRRGMCRACHERDLTERRMAGPIEGRITRDPVDRLTESVHFDVECWLWTGQLNNHGYGLFSYKNRKRAAHLVLWEHVVGPVPNGLELDHLCRVRHCVNPDHLEPVTHEENQRRAAEARDLEVAS